MLIELEAKILNVDPEETTSVILAAGGRRVQPATLMRRRVYDIVAGDESRWIRLRDTGAEVTVAVEEIAHDGIDGTRETEEGVGEPGVVECLVGLAGDADADVRGAAARALAEAMDKPEDAVRFLDEMGSRREAEFAAALRQLGGSETSYSDRAKVVKLLGVLYLRGLGTLEQLAEHLLDEDNDVRRACVRAFVEIGGTSSDRRRRVIDLLLKVLEDPRFDAPDKYENRTGKDYAYQGLRTLLADGDRA
jgi:hypothetical protein